MCPGSPTTLPPLSQILSSPSKSQCSRLPQISIFLSHWNCLLPPLSHLPLVALLSPSKHHAHATAAVDASKERHSFCCDGRWRRGELMRRGDPATVEGRAAAAGDVVTVGCGAAVTGDVVRGAAELLLEVMLRGERRSCYCNGWRQSCCCRRCYEGAAELLLRWPQRCCRQCCDGGCHGRC